MEGEAWAWYSGVPLRPSSGQHGGAGGIQGAQEVVLTDAGEEERALAQGTAVMRPEVGHLHLGGHRQP